MNVSDFISKYEYESYCKNTIKGKPFSVEKVVKVNGNNYTLGLRANLGFDNKYRLFTNFYYNYKDGENRNRGGRSFLWDCFDWQEFQSELEKELMKYPDYNPNDQLSLF